jgi:NadR type nicotinamide-nucleotide adenylyltransferase
MNPVPRICIVGAESTGKTTLAQALAHELNSPWVPEYLRAFCSTRGRTPRIEEQALILETQIVHELASEQTAKTNGSRYVICDTAPLMTAVYSDYIFSDKSLYERAIMHHRSYALTLLLTNDLPWVEDGIKRDGAHVRQPINAMIRAQLEQHRLPYATIAGVGHERTATALRAIIAINANAA